MPKPILLYSVIYPETARLFTEKILAIPASEAIDIWVNSPGGNPNAGWSMAAALQGRKNVNMTVMGDASSMAFYFLLFATKVIAYDTAKLLIHRAAAFEEEKMSKEQLSSVIAQNNTIREKLESRVDEKKFIEITGVTFDEIFSMESRIDVTLTAEQGKEIGLVDEVVILDTRKREEIESAYYDSIAALAAPQEVNSNNNINTKSKKMGIFDSLLGSKKPLLLAKIEDKDFIYGELKQGEKVKALGDGDISISGNFEANDSTITVIDNVITAITPVDVEDKRIKVLEATVNELKATIEASVKKEVIPAVNPKVATLEATVRELQATITAAKLSVSSPKLPVGEFKEDAPDVTLTAQERLSIAQAEAHEAKIKEREGI